MPHILRSRVAETSTTTGTGAFTLAGAVAGHQTFAAAMAVNDTTEYVISGADGSWEVGVGTLTASTTLARTTVIASSNAGSAVSFAAGSKSVAITPLATRISAVPLGGTANQVLAKASSTDFDATWLTLGTGAFATIANYATLASPTFTGTPAAPTAAADTNTTQLATTAFVIAQAGSTSPAMNGTAAVGTSLRYARADHVHASDTSRAGLSLANTFTNNQTISGSSAGALLQVTQSGAGPAIRSAGNLDIDGTSRRITADFSNATLASRAMFQSSTANGNTTISVLPNGTATASQFAAYAGSDPANVPFGALLATATQIQIISNKNGTGTTQSLAFLIDGATRATFGAAGALDLATGLREARVAMGASDIDVRAGNYFTRTISGATTLTVSNVPAAGTAASFILDLTNGGSATITWWSGVKWAGGTAPTLTSSGRDVLGFFTHDAGTTWTGLLLGKDVK